MKKLLTAVAAACLLATPAYAQTVKTGVEFQSNAEEQTALTVEATKAFGESFTAKASVKTGFASDKADAFNELVVGVSYDVPWDFEGFTPFGTLEAGIRSDDDNVALWGAEFGMYKVIDERFTGVVAFRHRDGGIVREERIRGTAYYKLAEEHKVGLSYLVWDREGNWSNGVAVDYTKSF